jgi:tetratricopeptide (TPR) repeat protein
MRARGFGVAAALIAIAGSATAAEPLAFLPPVGDTASDSALGLIMHARAEQILVEAGAPAVINLRHVVAVAELLGAPPASWWDGPGTERIARLLGARRFVAARLHARGAAGFTLETRIVEAGRLGPPVTTPLPFGLAAAWSAGARALAMQATGAIEPPTDAHASAVPDRAVGRLAACYGALLAQPIVLESPPLLRGESLDAAAADCREALALAPGLDEARGALALALAIADHGREAAEVLAKAQATGYVPSLWLAHYWLATRYRSPDAGLGVLREVVRRWPGSLLARSLLAEHLYVTHDDAAALRAWNEAAALTPGSALARARASAVLARLGRHVEAIAAAKEAAALLAGEPSGAILLASRDLDAGRFDDALGALAPFAGDDARPEVAERLGRAWLGKGQPARAKRAFERALDGSGRTVAFWRTRGRAWAGLVRVAAARGDRAATEAVVRRAVDEGFAPFLRALRDRAVAAALDETQARAPAPAPRPTGTRWVRPAEATPFVLDAAGEVDPHARAFPSTPPDFIELLRF